MSGTRCPDATAQARVTRPVPRIVGRAWVSMGKLAVVVALMVPTVALFGDLTIDASLSVHAREWRGPHLPRASARTLGTIRMGVSTARREGGVMDADFSDATFQAQMAALRRQYVAGLAVRSAALADAWRACSDGGGEAAWLALRDVAHRLSGSASSYGFVSLGAAARELDGLLSGHPPCRVRAAAEAAVTRVRTLLDAAMAGSPPLPHGGDASR
ncbi:MAG: Hpt domain-containing protein [Rhodanobacteraceae bacterium]